MKRKYFGQIKKKNEKKNVSWNDVNEIVKILEMNSNDIIEPNSKGKSNESDNQTYQMKIRNNITINKIETDKNVPINNNKEYDDEKNYLKNSNAFEKSIQDNIIKDEKNMIILNLDDENKREQSENIISNINSEFKNIVYDSNGFIEKDQADIVEILGDGNCLYRAISYFLFNTQAYYNEIKDLVIEWIENNYDIFLNFFGDDDSKNLKKEILAKEELEYTKKKDSWGGDIQINILCIILKLTIAVYYESNGKYLRYFLFNLPNIEHEEIIILLYINNRHYNLIYPKRNNQKNKKLYSSPDKIDKNKNFSYNNKRLKVLKSKEKYVKVNYRGSEYIYDEITEFLESIEKKKDQINEMILKYPKMNINQIYSYFDLCYPKRMIGKSLAFSKKRKVFRDLCTNFKLDDTKRLLNFLVNLREYTFNIIYFINILYFLLIKRMNN